MQPPICQVALSVSDLARSRAWYQRLGLLSSGGLGPIRGELPARMVELAALELNVGWLAGRDPMTQLELMCFAAPVPQPFPPDWSLRTWGYGITGLVAPQFDQALAQLTAARMALMVTGEPGRRSAWLRDPDQAPLELLESDPLGTLPAARGCETLASIRTVTLTVADLPRAVKFWTSTLGLEQCAPGRYSLSEIPAAWSGGANLWEAVLQGGPFLLRLFGPHSATTQLIQDRRRLHDLGPMNVAVIVEDAAAYRRLLDRFTAHGYRLAAADPMELGSAAGTMFARGDQNVSVEIGYVSPGHAERYGWKR